MNKKQKWLKVRLENLAAIRKMSTCLSRTVGAVLLRNNRIISEGFNGAPCGVTECTSTGFCFSASIPSGHGLDRCIAVHAEVNCLLNAARNGVDTKDSVLVCTTKPCLNCLKSLVNGGVRKIFFEEDYTIPEVQQPIYNLIIKDSGIKLEKITEDTDLS